MYKKLVFVCLQVVLLKEAFSVPLPTCGNNLRAGNTPTLVPGTATVATGNAMTTVTALPTYNANGIGVTAPIQTTQVTPLVTEIIPSLQFGDITVGGDLPVGGTIKVCGCFPIYGMVSVDGNVPSAGTAVINTGTGYVSQIIEPTCRF